MLTKFSGIPYRGTGSTKMQVNRPSTRQVKRDIMREQARIKRRLAKSLGGDRK